jgi:hypothetical protein
MAAAFFFSLPASGKTYSQGGKPASVSIEGIGDPGWIRTSDLQLRRLLLYPLSYGAA